MKIIMTIVAMCLMLAATQAQNTQMFVAEKIVEECSGTILLTDSMGGTTFLRAELSSYYDDDLVKMSVSAIVQKYSDLEVLQTWRKREDNIQAMLLFNDDEAVMVINYNKNNNIITIGWKYSQ